MEKILVGTTEGAKGQWRRPFPETDMKVMGNMVDSVGLDVVKILFGHP